MQGWGRSLWVSESGRAFWAGLCACGHTGSILSHHHTALCDHCMNCAVLLYGLALDVQNHPSLVSDPGNKAIKKQVAWGGGRIQSQATSLPQILPYPIKAHHCGCWGGWITP